MTDKNDNIYIDLLLSNSIQTTSNARVPIQFFQTQTQPVLKNTTGYQLSVIRFYLNTELLPVFIPTMLNGSQSTTIYSFTMTYNGYSYQQYMQFTPQVQNAVDPDELLYVYSYQYLINLMNNALESCLINLNTLTPTLTSVSPYLLFDQTLQRCSLTLDDNYFGYNEPNKINIYMNYSMNTLLSSLPSTQVNYNTSGQDYQINNSFSQDPTTLQQEYSTVPIWSPISSIIFTTNVLPISCGITPPIQLYVNGTLSNNNSTFAYLNILTDFIADNMQFTPFIQYSPSIYRFIDLKPGVEIKTIDLQVYWSNKNNGVLKPLYLPPGGSVSVKLLLNRV
jgi:hypothetical protein